MLNPLGSTPGTSMPKPPKTPEGGGGALGHGGNGI
jgi:hypothetical protein